MKQGVVHGTHDRPHVSFQFVECSSKFGNLAQVMQLERIVLEIVHFIFARGGVVDELHVAAANHPLFALFVRAVDELILLRALASDEWQ